MKRIVVTGGSGKAGRAVVRELLEHGYTVLNVDLTAPAERLCPFLKVDLTHYGETIECLDGADAVAHLAAIPAPGLRTEEATFRENIAGIFNIFEAAGRLKLQKVVWASSETTIGLPFEAETPAYAPIGVVLAEAALSADRTALSADRPRRRYRFFSLSGPLSPLSPFSAGAGASSSEMGRSTGSKPPS